VRVLMRGVPNWRRAELLADLDDDLERRRKTTGGIPLRAWRVRELWSLGCAYRAEARRTSTGSVRALTDGVVKDARYAWRALRRSPGFSLTATLVLTLGIGLNTAIFSLVNAVLYRPLPVRAPGDLTFIYQRVPRYFG